MSFIAGVMSPTGDSKKLCREMLGAFRRPASAGKMHSPSMEVALGVCLSRDLPEDVFDRQPLANHRYLLVGDVRIDNRSELAARLGFEQFQAREMADSELFLAAWSVWQKECVRRVIGGFAVAVWDVEERELTLVRDHCGERPLHYAQYGNKFMFASMPRALRCIPGFDCGLNEDYLLRYLTTGPGSGLQTAFNGIYLLGPGHLLVFKEQIKTERYWHPMDAPTIRLGSDDDYVEALLERFDAAVRARLRTVGKVGSHLSGGMDSSSVTATAARQMGDTRLTAFTAVPHSNFNDLNPTGRFGNEGPAAARVAGMYANIDHVFVEPSGADMVGVIRETGSYTDCPVYNPLNQMWLNGIMDEARQRGIRVVLHGSCGNATVSFGGLIGLAEMFGSGRWVELFKKVKKLRSGGYTSWRGAAMLALGHKLPVGLRKYLRPEMRSFDFAFSPAHPDRVREHGLAETAHNEFFEGNGGVANFRHRMLDFFDGGFVNGGVSAGWDISYRDPMQDKCVFEFCYGIPIEQYLVGGRSRSLVRRSMRGRLPAEVLSCTTRGLQAADWYLTMGGQRKQMNEELMLIRQSPIASRLLDLERLQTLLDTWPACGYEQSSISDSYHLALTRGLAAGNFIRHAEKAVHS